MPGIIPSPPGPEDFYTQEYTTTVSSSSPSAGTRIRNPNCINCGLEMSTATARPGYSCNNCERNRLGSPVTAQELTRGLNGGPVSFQRRCSVCGDHIPEGSHRHSHELMERPAGGPTRARTYEEWVEDRNVLRMVRQLEDGTLEERTVDVATPGPNARWGTTTSDRIYGEMLDNLARASSPLYYYDPATDSVGPQPTEEVDWRRVETINAYWKGKSGGKEEPLEQLVSGDVGSLWDKRPLKANN